MENYYFIFGDTDVVVYIARDDGSGILYDKYGDFQRLFKMDTGTKIIGYWCSKEKAKEWVERMLNRKVYIV